MHGSYRRNFGPENVAELNQNIDAQHEELLRTDDLDKKADSLRYLAGYAMQYLYLVPHNKKFVFKETERVLHSSAMRICDFDPREASLAFEHLARYSHNLLEQPWRSDFHIVKLTSGFFVHNIAAHIHNAHELLIAMGYVNVDDVTLKLCPSYSVKALKAVSRDCYVASQECLILSQIWQRVSDQEPDYPLTIGEVFEFRIKYMGDTDTICKTLVSDIRRRQHEFRMSKHASQQFQNRHFVPVDKLIDYDGMDVDNSNGYYPEREKEIVKKVLENTKMQQEESHVYDAVCNGRIYPDNGYKPSPFSPSNNSSSGNFIFPGTGNSYGSNRLTDTAAREKYDRNSLSPMIPQTVANFCARSPNRNLSQSSSPGSLGSRGAVNATITLQPNGHLNFSKMNDHEKSRTENLWSEDHRSTQSGRSRKPISAYNGPISNSSRKSEPIRPYDVYRSNSGNGFDYMDDTGEATGEDVLNEALEYASEIKGLVPGDGKLNKSGHHFSRIHHAVKSGWDTDSRSASSASRISIERDSDKKSASSTDASSWDNISNHRPNQSDLADANSYPLHHSLEKVNNSRQASINKVSTKPSTFIGTPSPEARGIKLYSQSQVVPRESYDSSRYTQNSRQKENVSEYQSQYSRNSSCSSSSPSPHFTPLSRIDKTDVDMEIKRYVEQHISNDNTLGPKPQPSYVAQASHYDQSDCVDAGFRPYIEQAKSTDKLMGHRRSIRQLEEMPQSSFAVSRGTTSILPHFEETNKAVGVTVNNRNSTVEEMRHLINDRNDLVVTTHSEPFNTVTENTVQLLDKNPIRPVLSPPNIAHNLEQFVNLENVKNCDPERDNSKSVTGEANEQPKSIQPWQCKFCTLINRKSERICEVCAKSKDFVEEPEEPLILPDNLNATVNADTSAQAYKTLAQSVEQKLLEAPVAVECKSDEIQCSVCTLINNTVAKCCEACGNRLREIHSPSRGGF